MKQKIFKDTFFAIVLTITLGLLSAFSAEAATPTDTPTVQPSKKPASEALSDEITKLKERIATRVAELRLIEKRGIVGTVNTVKATEISLTDVLGNVRFIDVDEFTKFTGKDSKATFDISSIKKNMLLSVVGRYNKQSERLLARFVKEVALPVFIFGSVSDINASDFSFVITTSDGSKKTIDVETVTKTQSYEKDQGLIKAGFSKLKVGNRVAVTGYQDKSDPKRISSTSVIILLDSQSAESENTQATPQPRKKLPSPTAAEE